MQDQWEMMSIILLYLHQVITKVTQLPESILLTHQIKPNNQPSFFIHMVFFYFFHECYLLINMILANDFEPTDCEIESEQGVFFMNVSLNSSEDV